MKNKSTKVPAVWKEDKELGIAYFCNICHRFVCSNMKCDCGADIERRHSKDVKISYFEKTVVF